MRGTKYFYNIRSGGPIIMGDEVLRYSESISVHSALVMVLE